MSPVRDRGRLLRDRIRLEGGDERHISKVRANVIRARPVSNGMRKRVSIIALLFLIAPSGIGADSMTFTTNLSTSTPGGITTQTSSGSSQGCDAGQYGGSPGTTAAISGVFVPVSDAAVTLNTGVLVYKECVLRKIVNAQRGLMTAAVVRQGTLAFQTGREQGDDGGNVTKLPLYPQNFRKDAQDAAAQEVVNLRTSGAFENLNPVFKDRVERAALTSYARSVRDPYGDLRCDYKDLDDALNRGKNYNPLEALGAFLNPACSPVSALQKTSEHIASAAAVGQSEMIMRLNWSGGVYDVSTRDEAGNLIVQTPGRFVAAAQEQLLTSGFRQTEMATDINQMVGALFTGMGAQILQGGGLQALAQSNAGQPSYLDQVVSAAQRAASNASNSAGVAVLKSMRAVEQAYGDIMRAILSLFTNSADSIRAAERQCWANIVAKACSGPVAANGTCTSVAGACTTDESGVQSCPTGATLQVATSTHYSTLAISLLPGRNNLVNVDANVNTSSSTIAFFDQLIATLSTDQSGTPQQQALNQLDALIRSNRVHTKSDVTNAQTAQTDLSQQIKTYTDATAATWSGASGGTAGAISWNGTYPPANTTDTAGWCNFNDSTTIQRWITKWTK